MHHGGSRVNSSRRGVKLDGHQQRGEAGVQNLELGVHHHHHLQGNFMKSRDLIELAEISGGRCEYRRNDYDHF